MELNIERIRFNKRHADDRMLKSATTHDIWEHIAALWIAVEQLTQAHQAGLSQTPAVEPAQNESAGGDA